MLSAFDSGSASWFAVVLFSLAVAFYLHQKRKSKQLPPVAPYSLWENVTRTGYVSLPHKVESSEWVCDNTDQDTSKGATFALTMPLPYHFFTTADYQLCRIVLSGSADGKIKEADKSPTLRNINLYPDIDSILTASTKDEFRAKTRKFMSPAFSTLNLQKTTLRVLQDKTVAFIGNLRHLSESSESIDIKELNVNVIFEVLAESLFDLRLEDDLGGFDCQAFLDAQNTLLREGIRRSNNPLRGLMFWSEEKKKAEKSFGVLRSLGATVLKKHREKNRERDEGSVSIIDHLIEHDYPSEEHRISDLIVFLIAGHETTAHSLSFFLYCIAKNEDARIKLQQELDQHLPPLSTPPTAEELDKISPSAIGQLEYFSWCLKESQRLFPVAPVVGRQLQEELKHNGYVLPKNSIVAVHLYAAGRQRWIEEADKFKPERWSKSHPQHDQVKQLPSLFSMGKRSCIGQNLAMLEMKVLASHLIRNFDFKLAEEPELDLFITLKPKSLKMNISRRT